MRSLILAALAFASLPALATSAPALVTLLPSGPGRVRFAVEAGALRVDAVPGESFVHPMLEGFSLDGAIGAPALPVRTVTIAVPPEGEVRVSARAFDPETREGVDIAPLPEVPRAPDGRDAAAIYRRLPLAARSGGAPSERALLIGVTWLRNQRVATIAVRATDWDESAKRLTVWHRIEVDVELAATGAATLGARAFEDSDPFETVYLQSLLNYEQGRSWRRREPASSRSFGASRMNAAPTPALLALPPDTSVFAGRVWLKLAITQTGFYRVNFGQLRNFALFAGDTTVAVDSVRLFTLPGVPVLPEDNYCDGCDYREVAIRVNDNGDLRFNRNSDELEFFALGPNDWANRYDTARPDSLFINNPYETRNYYYLAVGTPSRPIGGTPKRILTQDAAVDSSGSESLPVTFEDRQHYEQDVEYLPDLSPKLYSSLVLPWEKFFWRTLGTQQQLTVSPSTPGVETSLPGRVRAHLWGISTVDHCAGDLQHRFALTVNGTAYPESLVGGFSLAVPVILDQPATLQTSGNTVQLSIDYFASCPSRVDRMAIAWVDVRYQRRFEPVAGVLTFDSPATGGNSIYRVGPFTSATPPRIFDVTQADSVFELLATGGYGQDGLGNWYLRFETNEPGRRSYRILPTSGIAALPDLNLTDAANTSLENLRSRARTAEYLLIYYDGFEQAAEELRELRSRILPLAGRSAPFEAIKIPVSALYDQFSGGRIDPMAIRNFLRAAFFNWRSNGSPPSFVTLLGDASYDFKNILGRAQPGQPGALVPSYENGLSISRAFATDDVLLNVDSAAVVLPDFFGGRIPVSSAAGALDFVRKKVMTYEETAPLGPHRNRIMLIADDNEQGSSDDPLHWEHVGQTSELDTVRVPPEVDRAYVYLHKYPDGPSDTKPAAKAAIKNIVNRGTALFNYIGHGSPFQIADEKVLLDVDAGTFDNSDRLSIFVAASCDVGKFNDPVVPSLGERTLLAANGGAVAVISATELAYSQFNVSLASEFYRSLFDRANGGGLYHTSVAQALLSAKIVTGITPFVRENNQKYQVLGDAAIHINLPRHWVDVQLFACETCTTPLTEIVRGQTVSLRGRVLDRPGGAVIPLSGIVDVLVEDSAPYEQTPLCELSSFCPLRSYFYEAGPIYRGDLRATDGLFTGQFIVPLEAKGGARARVRGYTQGRLTGESTDRDGSGSLRLQLSAGSPSTTDASGPTITLSFPGGATAVKADATLQVDLFDESGILITDHNPQNGIIVTIDGNTTSRADITSSFRYAAGSYQSGTASFPLPNLALGSHTIQVCAADNFAAGLTASAHRSCATLAFTVAETPPLQLVSAYLFPNPANSGGPGGGGQFIIDARGQRANALLRIYTSSGRLIRTLKAFDGVGQIQIPWDGLDAEGDELANGVYFFRVQINAREQDGASSPTQTSSGDGRFVIVHR